MPTACLLRRVRRAISALAVVAAALPGMAGAAGGHGPRAAAWADPQLDEVGRRLEAAQQDLATSERRAAVGIGDLQRLDRERAELDRRLAQLERELAGAQQALTTAEARVARTVQELALAQGRSHDLSRQLQSERDALARRVRASYMFGETAYVTTLLEVGDIRDLPASYRYVRAVLRHGDERVRAVERLQRAVAGQSGALEGLHAQRRGELTAAQAERDRVAAAAAELERLRAALAARVEEHRLVLAQLESDRAASAQLVAALAEESAALTAELRHRAEQERQRRAAAGEAAGEGVDPSWLPGLAAGERLAWPAAGQRTSDFGWRTHPIFGTRRLHTGIDIGAPAGTPIVAAADGVVAGAGPRGGYGNTTVVDHGAGFATLYAHQSRLAAAPGTRVRRGDVLGFVGSTGFSTGPHLHFEVRRDGTPVDPLAYL